MDEKSPEKLDFPELKKVTIPPADRDAIRLLAGLREHVGSKPMSTIRGPESLGRDQMGTRGANAPRRALRGQGHHNEAG